MACRPALFLERGAPPDVPTSAMVGTMSPAPGLAPTLADRLQRVTGQLATTHDRHAICRALLAPAMEAVDAAAGAVLIVSDSGDDLTLEAVHGHAGGAPILWPGGPLAASILDRLRERDQ